MVKMNFKLAELGNVLVPRTAINKYHKLGDLKQKFILTFWRLEV